MRRPPGVRRLKTDVVEYLHDGLLLLLQSLQVLLIVCHRPLPLGHVGCSHTTHADTTLTTHGTDSSHRTAYSSLVTSQYLGGRSNKSTSERNTMRFRLLVLGGVQSQLTKLMPGTTTMVFLCTVLNQYFFLLYRIAVRQCLRIHSVICTLPILIE